MIQWDIVKVTECVYTRKGLQKIIVEQKDGTKGKAIHYTDVLPSVSVGDYVLINTTAVHLSLGSGGYHFVHTILSRAEEVQELGTVKHEGHMMKLRYTALQRSFLAAEESTSPYHELFMEPRGIDQTPVLIGELHSMLPISMCWFHHLSKQTDARSPKIVYIMSDGGALPLTFSDHTAALCDLGWLSGTVTYGQAYGGDVETINKFTALIAAKHILKADIIIVLMGPGIVGTGTLLGHSGIETGELVNAVSILGGIPIMIPRISFADVRDRHQGLSHHTLTSLDSIALKKAWVPMPDSVSEDHKLRLKQQLQQSGCDQKHINLWIPSIASSEIETSLQDYPHVITTMGRGLSEDPDFFLGVCAAAQVAWNHYCGEYANDEHLM